MVKGVHYLELVEPIKQLKREGRLDEALQLCYQAIQGAENDRGGREPAPAYTIDAAIIHRKLKQRDEEIAPSNDWTPTAESKRSQTAHHPRTPTSAVVVVQRPTGSGNRAHDS